MTVALVIMAFLIVQAYFAVLLFAALVCGIASHFVTFFTNLEYEYTYVDRELTVDRIASRSKRKRLAVYTLTRMEIFAPIKSYHLDSYKNRKVKTLDYSIGEELQPDLRYCMYYEGNLRLVLSHSVDLIKAIKNEVPRKVYTDL
jgi:hypothetical protein